MHVVTPSPDHTTTTPNAVMTKLATPSLGSTELSSWRVRMEPEAAGPEHTMDREQLWTVLTGALSFTIEGTARTVPAGDTAVLPAGIQRRIRTVGEGPAEAVVAMRSDGQVSVAGEAGPRSLPWTV
ncbi:cupin domain-containing protein [Streptomyces sp. I05A-00742]|uniref:cupin domain-containing protein n=1 Tax=Streptomyces sp. I05A-00742 TaxID=2732853 RepID=UPI001489E124|nr:cupin domain-containing protein [Streptomyces sp. I05A-00742]